MADVSTPPLDALAVRLDTLEDKLDRLKALGLTNVRIMAGPDFCAVLQSGFASLCSPQYFVSLKLVLGNSHEKCMLALGLRGAGCGLRAGG